MSRDPRSPITPEEVRSAVETDHLLNLLAGVILLVALAAYFCG